ncbi:MAG: ABC transporter permease [Woeseiaceae bacterium]|nr:ABC transporter permease [Woeseiaceae bacterium]
MSRSVIERRAHSLLPWLAAAGAGCALLSLLLVQVSGDSLAAGLTALFFLIFGLGLCLPPAVRWLTRGCAWFARRFAGNAASLAIAGVAASLSRTGVAIVALAVAVSATIGVSIMVDSFRTSVSSWLDQTLRSDFYVALDGGGDMAPSLVADLAAVDGVAAWSSSRRAWLETPEGRTRLVALKMAPESFAGTTLLDADPDTVWPAFERGEAVVVSEALAYRRAIRPGNTLTLQTGPGPRGFDVAATFRSYDANPETVLVSRRLYDRFWDDPAVDSLGIYLEPDADAQRVQARLRAAAGDRAVLSVRSNRDLRQRSLEIFDRTFIITHVLYWLAVGVAVIGILGAMLRAADGACAGTRRVACARGNASRTRRTRDVANHLYRSPERARCNPAGPPDVLDADRRHQPPRIRLEYGDRSGPGGTVAGAVTVRRRGVPGRHLPRLARVAGTPGTGHARGLAC